MSTSPLIQATALWYKALTSVFQRHLTNHKPKSWNNLWVSISVSPVFVISLLNLSNVIVQTKFKFVWVSSVGSKRNVMISPQVFHRSSNRQGHVLAFLAKLKQTCGTWAGLVRTTCAHTQTNKQHLLATSLFVDDLKCWNIKSMLICYSPAYIFHNLQNKKLVWWHSYLQSLKVQCIDHEILRGACPLWTHLRYQQYFLIIFLCHL